MNPPQAQPHKEDGGIRPGGAGFREKRGRIRVRDRFPATLVAARGVVGGRRVAGEVKDYDEAGACVECPRPLPVGAEVRIRLHVSRTISNAFRGLPCEFGGRVAAVRKRKSGEAPGWELVLRWDEPLARMLAKVVSSYQRKIAVLIVVALASVVWLKWQSLDFFWYAPFFYVYSTTLLVYLVSRFFISWRHRSPALSGYTPAVSIIISVRDEEEAIARTVETCYRTDYPAAKREVLVVDDGSKDGTPRVLRELRKKFPDLQVRTLPPQGKRAAMAQGVLDATGEIIIFVDSDTFLFPDALRHIVCGFEDPTLGASAGYTEVENANTNALTGLQEVRYYVSYRLLKSSESLFNCVTCCPGCLSAYRREYVLEVLEPWLHQTFLGAAATFGDDRSLTNFILRRYRVIYNDLAVASTWCRPRGAATCASRCAGKNPGCARRGSRAGSCTRSIRSRRFRSIRPRCSACCRR